MTYLFVCGGSYVSGMEIVELAIMRGLAARGRRVHVLVNGWNDGDFPARLEAAGIPYTVAFTGKLTVSPRRLDWMADTLRHWPGARRTVRALIARLEPDVVVVCNRDSLVLLAGLFSNALVAYHVHEAAAPTAMARRWTRVLRRLADRFLAVSEFVRRRLIETGVPPGQISVVMNGVALPEPAPSVFEPSERVPVVGICGQVGPWKGHDDLLEALGQVRERGIPFEFRIYGRGDDRYVETLRARIQELDIPARWMGFEADRDRMYAALDVLAVPSRIEETFGMTAAEAGAYGLPVAATRTGGLLEVVVHGETGLLVPPGDPDALADALATLLTNHAYREQLGQAARSRVLTQFQEEHMVDRFEAATRPAA
jgi:glycosyltransferase involved in cell wall biosynthesis